MNYHISVLCAVFVVAAFIQGAQGQTKCYDMHSYCPITQLCNLGLCIDIPPNSGLQRCITEKECNTDIITKKCYYGVCASTQPTSCKSHQDCPWLSQHCIYGLCVDAPANSGIQRCSYDWDCGSTQMCSVGVCVAKPTTTKTTTKAPTTTAMKCTIHSNCPISQLCNYGTCINIPTNTGHKRCYTDKECDTATTQKKCYDGVCLKGSPIKCTSHAHCPLTQQCDYGVCNDIPANSGMKRCFTNAECGSTEICNVGVCIAAPVTSAPIIKCYDSHAYCPLTQMCEYGVCVNIPAGSGMKRCFTNAECGSAEICNAGVCIAAPVTPAPIIKCYDSHAYCPLTQMCQYGVCVNIPAGSGIVRCSTGKECGSTQACMNGECKELSGQTGIACKSDEHCAKTELCYAGWCTAMSALKKCGTTADCDAKQHEVCRYNLCYAILCGNSAYPDVCPTGTKCGIWERCE